MLQLSFARDNLHNQRNTYRLFHILFLAKYGRNFIRNKLAPQIDQASHFQLDVFKDKRRDKLGIVICEWPAPISAKSILLWQEIIFISGEGNKNFCLTPSSMLSAAEARKLHPVIITFYFELLVTVYAMLIHSSYGITHHEQFIINGIQNSQIVLV